MQIDGTIPTKNDDVSKSEWSDLLAADNTPIIEKIRDFLIHRAGHNVLFSDSKQTASLIKCAYYLATQVQIIDESDKKERSLSILGNALNILRTS